MWVVFSCLSSKSVHLLWHCTGTGFKWGWVKKQKSRVYQQNTIFPPYISMIPAPKLGTIKLLQFVNSVSRHGGGHLEVSRHDPKQHWWVWGCFGSSRSQFYLNQMHKIVLSWWLKKRLKRTAVLVPHPRPPTQLPTKPRTLSQITTISFWVNESYYFLASQDALKVMLVSQSVSQSLLKPTWLMWQWWWQ